MPESECLSVALVPENDFSCMPINAYECGVPSLPLNYWSKAMHMHICFSSHLIFNLIIVRLHLLPKKKKSKK